MTKSEKKLWVDPPHGWLYGFPKSAYESELEGDKFNAWLIANGYPEDEITRMGEWFMCRFWEDDRKL